MRHQTRKTNNAHYETQKRYKKYAFLVYWRIAPKCRTTCKDVDYFVSNNSSVSKKIIKKVTNRKIRHTRILNSNTVNNKVKQTICSGLDVYW